MKEDFSIPKSQESPSEWDDIDTDPIDWATVDMVFIEGPDEPEADHIDYSDIVYRTIDDEEEAYSDRESAMQAIRTAAALKAARAEREEQTNPIPASGENNTSQDSTSSM